MKKISGVIIGGIIALVGIAAMMKPFQAFFKIGWLVGALLFIHAIERIYRDVVEKKVTASKMMFRVVEAVIGAAILGSSLLQLLTDVMIVYVVGGIVVAYGVFFILKGIKVAERNSGKIIRGAIGLLIVGLGMVLISEPAGTMLTITYAAATAFALQGADIIMNSLFGRKEAFEDK